MEEAKSAHGIPPRNGVYKENDLFVQYVIFFIVSCVTPFVNFSHIHFIVLRPKGKVSVAKLFCVILTTLYVYDVTTNHH